MDLARARARYLAAIALALPAACKDGATPQGAPMDDGGRAEVVAPASASVATPPTIASTSTPPPVVPPGLPTIGRMPSCPTGTFCAAEPAATDAGAPAPYARCGSTATHPDDARSPGVWSRSVRFEAELTKAERAKDPKACCYSWVIPCPGGRPLRDDRGEVALPAMERAGRGEAADWSAWPVEVDVALPATERARRASAWAREGAYEHSSVASFAALALDLLALGAPAELVAGAHRAALDEIEHARACFAIASAWAGEPIGPGPLPVAPRASRSLAGLARSSFVEGCLGESVAAATLAARADGEPAAIGAILRRMAEDEERHAALAFSVVAWAVARGGEPIARIVAEESARASGAADRDPLRARVVAEVVAPCADALVSARGRTT